MKRTLLFPVIILFIMLAACRSDNKYVLNHTFDNNTWDRFNKLQFEMPANIKPGNYDILFQVRLQETFEYDRFPIFVTLNTSSGEERTNEIEMKIKDNDKFYGTGENNLHVITQKLWEGLYIADTGVNIITVENLIPKMQASGVNSVSLEMKKTGK
jgi:gliding motility-associated lipoprotein GldH